MGQILSYVYSEDTYPLHSAIKSNNIAQLSDLLNTTRDVNLRNEEGFTPLCLAARTGNEEAVSLLLNHPEIDVNSEDQSGSTALVLASFSGHATIVKKLISEENSGLDVNKITSARSTAFSVAHVVGNFDIAEIIMDCPRFDVKTAEDDEIALLGQTKRLNIEAVKVLICAGCDITMKDPKGRNALWYASRPPVTRGPFNILIQRVRGRGGEENQRREKLVDILVNVGVPVNPAILENISTTLPHMLSKVTQVMKSPESLLFQCRKNIWENLKKKDKNENWTNSRVAIKQMKIAKLLPSSLVDFLLYEELKLK